MAVRDSLPVTIGARKYNVDLAGLARSTIDPIRQGFDTQGTPGEQSLNQAGVWKRSRTSWDLGAGQREADTDEANNRRFYTSTGVDVWTRNEVSLLKSTQREDALSSTNLYMATAKPGTAVPDVTANHYIYCTDGSDVRYSNDNGDNWADISNPAGGALIGIASDGHSAYVASTAGGKIQKITSGAVSGSTDNTDDWAVDDVDGVWVANGYLLASVGSRLTQLAVGSAPSTDLDIASASFGQVKNWISIVGTPAGIYAAGTQGNTSRIFYIGINDSTTNPLNPVIAAELPQGETINVLAYYGGLLCIGTNKGIRLGMITGNGYVTYGPRIDIADHDGDLVGTSCFEAQGEFIWFGWTDYTSTQTGLGRLALSEFTSSLVPAYASDLMTNPVISDEQGEVQGVITSFDGRRLFSVSGDGIWQQYVTRYVTSGTIDSGRIRWGTTEKKAVTTVDVKHAKLAAGESVVVKVLAEDDVTIATGVTSDTDDETTPGITALPAISGEYVSSVITLSHTEDGTTTPILKRWTLRAIPMPFISEVIKLPIMLSTYTDWDNRHVYHDTYDDYAYLKGLMEARDLVSFNIGEEPALTVYVAGVSYDEGSLTEWTDDRKWFEGILTVQLVTVQT